MSKVDCLPSSGWASSNELKAFRADTEVFRRRNLPQDWNIETLPEILACCLAEPDPRLQQLLAQLPACQNILPHLDLSTSTVLWINSLNEFLSLSVSLFLYLCHITYRERERKRSPMGCISPENSNAHFIFSVNCHHQNPLFSILRLACIELVILFLYTRIVIISSVFPNQ